MSPIVVLLVLTNLFIAGESYNLKYNNRFEATWGCLQYTTNQGYNFTHPYFATSDFRNPPVLSNGTVRFRMGVLGEKNASIRLAPERMPYESTVMHEIALSHWMNKATEGRRYRRTSPSTYIDRKNFNRKPTPGLLDALDPLMFTVTIYDNGRLKLTRDNDATPFFEFNGGIPSHKFVGFANWDAKLIFFFDCPLTPYEQRN